MVEEIVIDLLDLDASPSHDASTQEEDAQIAAALAASLAEAGTSSSSTGGTAGSHASSSSSSGDGSRTTIEVPEEEGTTIAPPPPQPSTTRRPTVRMCRNRRVILPTTDQEVTSADSAEQGVRPPACKRPRRISIIPCDVCGLAVPFEEFETHSELHRRADTKHAQSVPGHDVECPECGKMVPFAEAEDHAQAHRLEKREQLRASRKAEEDIGDGTADAIAFRVVQLLRERGSGLPGNRPQKAIQQGEHVQALWKDDGRWYGAVVKQVNGDGTLVLTWAPPYQAWAEEGRQPVEHVLSLQGSTTREVVNFDTCVRFVRRMMALTEASREGGRVSTEPEVVFHWTPAQNHNSIIEDSLRVPGERCNHSGVQVKVINGEALGKGIYTSTDPNFGAAYGLGARGAFLCLGLPGRQAASPARAAVKHQKGAAHDSIQNGTVRVYTTSDLLLPCFITEVSAAPRLRAIMKEVSDLLLAKIPPCKPHLTQGAFPVGAQVKAMWYGQWYPARVTADNGDGTVAIQWAPPYQGWPADLRKPTNELRGSKHHQGATATSSRSGGA